MLAYVFWHRPGADVDAAAYEHALLAFHAALRADPPPGFRTSHTYARADQGWFDGYEDWYLVDDWTAIGALNAGAVDAGHKAIHDAAAIKCAAGAAGIYRLMGGDPIVAAAATWSHTETPGDAVWQRQMVLGPTPEWVAHHRGAGRTPRRVIS